MTDGPDGPGQPRQATAVTAYFDSRSAVYRAAASRGLWGWQRRREARAVLALAGDMMGRSALDLGCGAGFYAELLARGGAGPVVAVDASQRMLAQIAEPRITTWAGDAATIKFDQRFDLIILAGVLEFVPDAESVLINARRHLADGGRIVVLLPADGLFGHLYRLFHRSHGVEITLFGRRRVAGLIAAAGLRQRRRRPVWPVALVVALEDR